MRGVVQQSVVETSAVNCDGDKDKKKKRRSSRRPKQTPPPPVNGIRGEALEYVGDGRTCNHVTASLSSSSSKQHGVNICHSNEHGVSGVSAVGYYSMPTMHIGEQVDLIDPRKTLYQNVSDFGGRVISQSCPEPLACGGLLTNKDLFPLPHVEASQKKIFDPHWSMEAVNEALKKGNAFRALFRVNAYNKFEAYCKIDGVPTDVLISGIAAQNRAVEGDIVVVKVEPLSLWTRMKGSTGVGSNPRLLEDGSLLLEDSDIANDSYKGKSKIDADCEYLHKRSFHIPEKGLSDGDGAVMGESVQCDPICNMVDGNCPTASDSLHGDSSSGQNEFITAVGRMCGLISSFPSKRPTGKIVAIIERSSRRNAIVGYLNVKQWFSYREFCRKDAKKNKTSLSISDCEYIHLIPTDSKFPKMTVLVKGLPDCIRERLEKGDATVEMELVAAQFDDWDEGSPLPQARILYSFGRGSELEPQKNVILFQNAISSSEFAPELLSSIPQIPWEVPRDELQSRQDLRNLCVFTIDPSTATDLDDAISVEKLSNDNFRVGVHIADVSYFVLPDTALDLEAQIRSTSVYMLHHKIPMLPPLLSESLASLNPGVDRLAFSIFLDINRDGDVVDRWIGRTVIHSCCKLSYEHAQDIIDGLLNADISNISENGYPQLHGQFKWSDVIRSVKSLYEISKILKEKRFSDGAIRLENCKVVFQFDDYGNPNDILLCERKESNFLIEELMLLANRTAAEIISRAFPDSALLRRHPEPNMRKLREFEAFCSKHGLELDASSSGRFNQSLQQIKEKLKDDAVLFDILISYASRPMQLATYFCSGDIKDSEKDWCHYALAIPFYTHFTSPLRRYPDIIVHRTLAAVMEAEKLYLKHQEGLQKLSRGEEVTRGCFSGIRFDREAAESLEGKEALSVAAQKHGVPGTKLLSDVAAYCNERKLASRNVKDACEKLYMWVMLKKREHDVDPDYWQECYNQVLFSEARVLGIGPRFMSVYVQKLAIERRIYYDEVESLAVEWLEATSTLVLSLCPSKRSSKRGSPGRGKALEDVAFVVSPRDLDIELGVFGGNSNEQVGDTGFVAQNLDPVCKSDVINTEVDPGVFPLTVRLLSSIPVSLHAVGGDDGPIEIAVRLYMSSYLK